MDITSRMGITNHIYITLGAAIPGLFVARGGKGVDWTMVTIRMCGRRNIIATDRPPMATGELGWGWTYCAKVRPAVSVSRHSMIFVSRNFRKFYRDPSNGPTTGAAAQFDIAAARRAQASVHRAGSNAVGESVH
jgi:hypothetical protein